jgi:outer membrane protein assembly factor BamB
VAYVVETDWDFQYDYCYVEAVDINTRQKKWKFEVKAMAGGYGAAGTSPVVSDGVVYVGTDDSYLHGVDAKTGQEIWKFRTDGYVSSSPAISDGVVYVGSDAELGGYLYAVK